MALLAAYMNDRSDRTLDSWLAVNVFLSVQTTVSAPDPKDVNGCYLTSRIRIFDMQNTK